MQNTEASDGVPKRNLGDDVPDKTITSDQWNDWRWQLKNRIVDVGELSKRFGIEFSDEVKEASTRFPLAITPYYLSLIKRANCSDPIYRMSVPDGAELEESRFLSDDPLGEEGDMVVPSLVHRYTDRALVLVSTMCSMYCRHCTRKRMAGHTESFMDSDALSRVVEYLRDHPRIKDVIISGGDPLVMSTESLMVILERIRSVESVEVIRIGTRVPVVMPMRVDDELVGMLREFHPLWVNTHFNHPSEMTKEAVGACVKMVDAGIPVGNQSVLLKGVNDNPLIVEELCRGLVRNRVRPYYLYMCDLVKGVEGFRTTVSKGLEIMEHLRGRLSGIAIPTFVIDAPDGGGKIPLLPGYMESMEGGKTVLRNFEGRRFEYTDPIG